MKDDIDLGQAVRWMQLLRDALGAHTLVAHYELGDTNGKPGVVDIVVDEDGHTLVAGDEAVPMVHKEATS